MHLLFVKLKHIGDTLLLTPTLAAVRRTYPDARIWVVVRESCESILEGCPGVDRVLTAVRPEAGSRGPTRWLRDFALVRELRRQRFDYAFELGDGDRGRWLVAGLRADRKCANVSHYRLNAWWRLFFRHCSTEPWIDGHQVEKDYRAVRAFLPLPEEIPPLQFSRDRAHDWAPLGAARDVIVLHPGTRWQRKRWPTENWKALAAKLQHRAERFVVSSGLDPEEAAQAREIAAALGPRALCTEGRTTFAELAGVLWRARLFVGVDTAVMHLAAACSCPTVALFGPSIVHAWRPWKARAEVVTAPRAAGSAEHAARIGDIGVEEVLAACERMLAAGLEREEA